MPPDLQKQKQAERVESIQKFVKTSASFQRVFNCPDGNVVLTFLKGQTAGFDKDPYQHAFNAGKSRMVEIIEQMLDEEQYKKHLDMINAQNKTT